MKFLAIFAYYFSIKFVLVNLSSVEFIVATDPVIVVYVDSAGIDWAAQPPIPIVNAGVTDFSHIYCSFYLPSLKGLYDFAEIAGNPNPIYGGVFFIQAMHAAGKKVVLSVGGATETPTSPAYYTANEPVALATALAKIVRNSSMDGVDIDFEDDYSNSNPGLTGFGSERKPGSGPAVAWLITLTQTLRHLLPASEGFSISHAPQPAYFALGYTAVHRAVGTSIDWYNVQYYNQGVDAYINYTTLVEHSDIIPQQPSIVSPWDGSLNDLINNQNIPPNQLVVGKNIAPNDANNGFIPSDEFAAILHQARGLWPQLRGAMGWQWGSDVHGAWAAAIKKAFLV